MNRSMVATALLAMLLAGCDCRETHEDRCDASACDGGFPDASTDTDAGLPDSGTCDCPTDAGEVAVHCDDGNPCTTDSLEAGVCRFEARADDTPCEDGDLCTLGDRCVAAECVPGDRAEGDFAPLGRLDSQTGKHVAVGDGRFVTISRDEVLRARVQLVSRTPAGLSPIASWSGYMSLFSDAEVLAQSFAGTDLVAVASQGSRDLVLFSATDAAVERLGAREISGQIVSMSGHGERLWICAGNSFTGYQVILVDLHDPSMPTEAGAMPLGMSACGSIAVNASGQRVYVNTTAGVRFVDAAPLDSGGDPTLSDVIAPPSSVNISGTHLILGTATQVRILDEADHQEVVAVPVARANAARLIGDRLLIEGARATSGGAEIFVSLYDAFASGGAALLDDVVITTHFGPPGSVSFQSDTDGTTLMVGSRMFDLDDDHLDEVRVPELMPTHTLRRGYDGLRAYTTSGVAAIDVSDITMPMFVGGGSFGRPSLVSRIAIDDSLPVPALGMLNGYPLDDAMRVPLSSSNPYYPSPFPIRRWALDTSDQLVSEETFSVPHEGTSQLLSAGDFLYSFRRPTVTSEGALEGYWLPALREGVVASPVFDLPIPGVTAAYRGFDVDPHGRVAVVSTDVPGEGAALLFYDLSTSPPTSIGMVVTDAVYRQIRVAGHRVVARTTEGVVFYELGIGEVSRYTTDRFVEQLLVFDGHVAYLSQLHLVAGASAYELAAVPFDGTTPGVITVDGVASSAVAVEGGLAFGFDNVVITAHPHCPASQEDGP